MLSQHVYPSRDNILTGSDASACIYVSHYVNAAGNLKSREPEAEPETEAQPTKQTGTGFLRYSWAELRTRVWNVDPQECSARKILAKRIAYVGRFLIESLWSLAYRK